ncbi:DUF6804 family protein [Xylanibacter ruminicola]|uniref:Uncharacterized protein n=1 Tax=Xylanibacter ruminicola TaxID=839 RepID=A0A1M6UE88_XYLRU|nr:DUF6804 family protein [Xylanibacter ruminicola]SHK67368.1 hypothetical protein SAMN05216463_1097 [Xylanibacter ruminicola]
MKNVPIILAVILLLCLAPMPYGYFTLVRFLAMVGFGYMAFQYFKQKKEVLTWTFVTLALLFQPFAKVGLGRMVWNVVDVVVAIGLVILFIMERKGGTKVHASNIPNLPVEPVSPKSDNRIEFKLDGKLAPKELIYIASEEDKELTDLFENNPEMLEGWGKMIGYHVIYLPLLLKQLQKAEVLQYRAPYMSEAEINKINIGNDFMLRFLDNPDDRNKIKQGFIRTEDIHRGSDGTDKAINRFYPISSRSNEPIADQLHNISKLIHNETSKSGKWLVNKQKLDDEQRNFEIPPKDADNRFNSQLGSESIDDLLDEIKERIIKLRQRGVSQFILEQLIHPDDRLSRLVITKDFRILLPDYNNMEIKMEPLAKAVYLLFLKHSEGIVFKCLPDYRKELAEIYVKLRPLGLSDRALQSIEDVTNPLLNSINEKCARIRGAFVGQFDDHMARHYYIDGRRGEAKKISLPRNLVVWE